MDKVKKVWGWVRGHWMFVVLGVIALVALPTGVIVAGMQTQKVRDQVQKDVQTAYDSVNKAKVNYALMAPTGEKLLENNTEVNSTLTAWYAERWEKLRAKTGSVAAQGLEFNKADHAPLVNNLFPQPPELEQQTKPREMAKAFIDLHPTLLAKVKAGVPPLAADVAAVLDDYQRSAMEQARLAGQTELGSDQKQRLTKELVDLRLQRYRARAMELGVYAEPGVFRGVPLEVPKGDVSLAQCWEWQELAWAHADIVRAIGSVNGVSEGAVPPGGVASAVVKRILMVDATGGSPAPTGGGGGGGRGGGASSGGETFVEPTPQPFKPGADKTPEDFLASITGRISGPATENKWYDIRTVRLEIIVASKRLPSFIDALASTNFMTVVGIELAEADAPADLRAGFYYGDDHVVRASITIETIWLREWRKAWMPKSVQEGRAMWNPEPPPVPAPPGKG